MLNAYIDRQGQIRRTMLKSDQDRYSVGGVLLNRPFKIRRLGHFGFNITKLDEGLNFYSNLLGFKVSDPHHFSNLSAEAEEKVKQFGQIHGYFMHHGSDHHSFVLFNKLVTDTLAAFRGRTLKPDMTINQITWQVGSMAEVANGAQFLRKNDVPIVKTGRDMPGSNWHVYAFDPDLHNNELYYGIEQIGWTVRSKPKAMYYRRFDETPPLPIMSEEDEIEDAKKKGIDVYSGHNHKETLPAKYDVEGVLLPRPFKVTKIGPVNLFVTNLQKSEAFYTKIYGFTKTEEVNYKGHSCIFLRCGNEHHSLALFPIELRAELGLNEHTTCASFGLEVTSYNQLRNAVTFLTNHGVKTIDFPEELHPGIDYAKYVLDPDGHCLQLYYYMEQLGWEGKPRPKELRRVAQKDWPENLEPLSDTYADQVFQGPLG